ncbi:DUF3293 domain-containing protein [Deinococcus caeni]|uniref:DUF3293 domain-containing protein n=1 Tax=Deinococcus caeni TaxID=569127 RepID=UPI0036220634
MTAWNPAGQAQDRAANRAAQARLRVAAARWSSLDGVNGDGDWQEPTLILTGISLRDVAALGGAFGQAAVLWGSGARAALVWLPASGVGACARNAGGCARPGKVRRGNSRRVRAKLLQKAVAVQIIPASTFAVLVDRTH